MTHSRCAIYTRKSTEHNLDLAFNSLDAQRESCEAYIKSQAHEGWKLIPTHFDDGGLSGASLDRPALRMLLDEVKARRIDVIVVYKVDRLTRSLTDFAKLVELFDANSVSFISVTQSFNTTSSMGRLTLNVLLSFAQFEREVIGERVRDKIAASKRKGIWTGGPTPFGYRSVNKALEVHSAEAQLVRKIFADYLEHDSLIALAASLEKQGITSKAAQAGEYRGFRISGLAYILKNRIYVGEIVYQKTIHTGVHEPIIDRETFDKVQSKLRANTVARTEQRLPTSALLAGRLFDDRGNPMTPTHTNKGGVRYRYYVSQALLQGRSEEAGSVARTSAPELESAVMVTVRAASNAADLSMVMSDHDLIQKKLIKAVVTQSGLQLTLMPKDEGHTKSIFATFHPKSCARPSEHASLQGSTIDKEKARHLLTAIARSRRWIDDLCVGRAQDFGEIAVKERCSERRVRLLIPLAYLSPNLIAAIAEGRCPDTFTPNYLARSAQLPWSHQEKLVGG